MDLQIGYLVESISAADDFQTSVLYAQRVLEFLLAELTTILETGPEEGASFTVLLPYSGRFRVLAQVGVQPGGIPLIESHLSYSPSIAGVAGLSAANRSVIYVPNVQDSTNQVSSYWRPLHRYQSGTKSVLCIPLDSKSGDLLAVISLSLPREIDIDIMRPLLDPLRAKAEIVLLLAHFMEEASVKSGGPSLANVELSHMVSLSETRRDVSPPPDFNKIAAMYGPKPTHQDEKPPTVALKRKVAQDDFDVFVAFNSMDESVVTAIVERLRQRGIHPWLSIEQVPPGRWFQEFIERAIPTVRSAAIMIGQHGLGRWQALELRSFISRCIDEEIPVIPVRLPGVGSIPSELVFLKELTWVAFNTTDDDEALDLLEWGITNVHPRLRETK